MLKTLSITLLAFLFTLSVKAKEIIETFEAAKITLKFTSGATKDKIVHIVKDDTIHVLVPHHAQNIYDPDDDRKYKYTVSHMPLNGWETVKETIAGNTYEVTKKPGADEIAPATKELIYTLSLKKDDEEASGSSNDNSSEAEMKTVEYKIILYTPSIHLSLHAASTHGSMGEKMKRPTTKEADTVEGFDTGYLGIMLRNEDNDDGDKIPKPPAVAPRDNDDDSPSSKDDDLVAVLMELKQPTGMPEGLKQLVVMNLLFKKSTDKKTQVFDEDKTKVKLTDLSKPINLSEPKEDKHISKLIREGKATIYLEGLGSVEDLLAKRWGDEIDQVTLRLTPGGDYKEANSHGLLIPFELRVRQDIGHKGPDGSKSLYETPRPNNGYIRGEVFSLWENEEAYVTIGGALKNVVDNGQLAKNSIKWHTTEVTDVLDKKEFKIKWSTTGQKKIELTLLGRKYFVHFVVPDVGPRGVKNINLIQHIGVVDMFYIKSAGEAARDAVATTYGQTPGNGGTRQDAIRHSTWNAVVANRLGIVRTTMVTTANEYTGKNGAAAIASNTVMDLNNNHAGALHGHLQRNNPIAADKAVAHFMAQMEKLYDAGKPFIIWIPENNNVINHHGMLRWSDTQKLFNE